MPVTITMSLPADGAIRLQEVMSDPTRRAELEERLGYKILGFDVSGPTASSPWFHAAADGRSEYIAPEDVSAAIKAGADPLTLAREVLDAIGRGAVEDPKLCAYVASTAIASAES